jgi:hypothetical protein
MVDAYTGDVIQSANLVHTAARFDTPTDGTGETLYLADVFLSTASNGNGGQYRMTDLETGVTTCDMMDKVNGPCREIASVDNHFGNHKQTDRWVYVESVGTGWADDVNHSGPAGIFSLLYVVLSYSSARGGIYSSLACMHVASINEGFSKMHPMYGIYSHTIYKYMMTKCLHLQATDPHFFHLLTCL